jgi:hypothetical protein
MAGVLRPTIVPNKQLVLSSDSLSVQVCVQSYTRIVQCFHTLHNFENELYLATRPDLSSKLT